jgi:hypothetical protein
MPIINESVTSYLILMQEIRGETIQALDCYGNMIKANIYFDNRLRSEDWQNADIDTKKKALVEATRLIDLLNYIDDKTSSSQLHEFPRDGDTEVPDTIELACYEVALKLIQGVDPELEQDNLAATAHSYGGVRTTYDRSFVPEHLQAGIPSAKAWGFLKPFLRDTRRINFSRVN